MSRVGRWLPFLLLASLPVVALDACGGGSVELSHEEYARLPADSQQEVFDAENDLVIAKNREDQAKERDHLLRVAQEELDERWKRAERRLLSSTGGSRVGGARKVLEAHRAFLKAELDVAAVAIKVALLETELSRARLSLVRKRQLVRIGRAPMVSLKDLEHEVSEAEKRVKAARATDVDLRMRAQNQLGAWKNAEDEYARSSGDFDTGVWLD